MADLKKVAEELVNYQFVSSSDDFRNFLRSKIWQDMRNELQVILYDRWEALEKETELIVIGQIQGQVNALKKLLNLPEEILIEIEKNETEDYD